MAMSGGDLLGNTSFSAPRGAAGDFTDSVAWSAQTEVSASDIIEKQRLVK